MKARCVSDAYDIPVSDRSSIRICRVTPLQAINWNSFDPVEEDCSSLATAPQFMFVSTVSLQHPRHCVIVSDDKIVDASCFRPSTRHNRRVDVRHFLQNLHECQDVKRRCRCKVGVAQKFHQTQPGLERKRRAAHCMSEHSQVNDVVTLFLGEPSMQKAIDKIRYARLNHRYPVGIRASGSVPAECVHEQTRYLDRFDATNLAQQTKYPSRQRGFGERRSDVLWRSLDVTLEQPGPIDWGVRKDYGLASFIESQAAGSAGHVLVLCNRKGTPVLAAKFLLRENNG